MRIAGHSSVTTSQRYVHPSSEAVSAAIVRLDSANQAALALESNRHQNSTGDSQSSVTH
jgi:hypothetical protein